MNTNNCTQHDWADTKLYLSRDKQHIQACRRCGILRFKNPPFREPPEEPADEPVLRQALEPNV